MRDGVDDKDDTSSVWDSPEDSASSDRRRRLSADTFTVEETRAVNIVKSLVYCTLIFTAIGVGLGSYFLIKHEQQKGFQAELEAVSDHAASEIENYLEGISTQLSELAAALSSLYLSSTVTKGWTNLTLPHFNKRIEQKNGVQELIFYSPIVQFDKKKAWENYSVANQGWIDESYINESSIPNQIYSHLNFGYSHTPFYIPVWQVSPIPRNRSIVNMDLFTYPATRKIAMIMISEQKNNTVISETFDAQLLLTFLESDRNQDQTTPRSLLALPVYDDFGPDANGSNVFGYVFALISWEVIFDMVFRDVNAEIIITMKESCGSGFSFNVASGKCIFTRSDNELSTTVLEFKRTIDLFKTCTYSMSIYATRHMESRYVNQLPTLSMALLVLLFGFLVAVFWQYDRLVQQRQSKLLLTAKRTNAVISSLFPEDVQKRIMAEAEEKEQTRDRRALGSITYNKMKEFLEDEKDSGNSNTALLRSKPIADFFPEATIMFADLVGFTAWSSMREPSQVFILLESIYHAFDEVARRRRVFKVETVGDCYVAVAGLPEPCEDHALVMSRFATDCRIKMNNLVKVLEVSLGPDTTDLNMRFGLHSGPVTAGVLRGDRARFQLFGDTVNTTSRLESTGKRDKIHISQETAEYLTKAGKQHWLTLREDKVTAKGKGELTTYWLHVTRPKKRGSSIASQSTKSTYDGSHDHDEIIPLNDIVDQGLNEKQLRLVDWMTNELMELLKDIATRRLTKNVAPEVEENVAKLEILSVKQTRKTTPFQELEEIITLPKFDAASSNLFHEHSPGHFSLPDAVVSELHDFVHSLAVMYQENPFHNFEHASHVTMSVVKLLSRIVAPNITFVGEDVASELHDQTYGITSDPLTQFTVVLSALIHDVDHPGVPNTQLVKEKTTVASVYKNKSVAEQNSVDKTWILLMEGNYANLRKTIYRTEDEFKRFRQLLVNTVLATDIMDEDLGSRRKARWSKAFSEKVEEDAATAVNRKATIVIEHIIQASDIAHSMQHWHIYRKWNGRLFEEMYKAYIHGRAERNPAENWYEGEMGFFDYYIIPLAKKLKDCGVFGVSSDEYLNYAQQNRKEWELNGEKVVENMIQSIRLETSTHTTLRNMNRGQSPAPGRRKTSQSPGSGRRKKASNGIAPQGNTYPGSVPRTGTRRTRRSSLKLSQATVSDDETRSLDSSSGRASFSKDPPSNQDLPTCMSILIVDDDKITRKLFSRTVEKIAPQWQIQDAESGEEALLVVEKAEKSFDLIFMDMYMGTEASLLLGSDAVAELRNRGTESIICGMSANDVETLFDDAGADAFIFKPLPFRPVALTRELIRILMSGDDWYSPDW